MKTRTSVGGVSVGVRRVVGVVALAILSTIVGLSEGKGYADDIKMLTPPCRLHDSRWTGAAKLVANTELIGGIRQSCGVPLTATAVFFNFTIISPPAAGWFKVYARGESAPDTAVITYSSGVTISNGALVNLRVYDPEADPFDLVLKSSASTDFIIDVVGYVTPSLTNETHATITSKTATCDSNNAFCLYTFGLNNGWSLVCANQNMDTTACSGFIVGGGIRGFGHLKQSGSTPVLYAHSVVTYP